MKWLRPDEIADELFKSGDKLYDENCEIGFVLGGAGSNDVKQSAYLGDCWFISALSLIASNDALL